MAAPVSRVHGPPQAGRIRRPTSANAHAAIVATKQHQADQPGAVIREVGVRRRCDERDPGQEQDEGVGGDTDHRPRSRPPKMAGTIAATPMATPRTNRASPTDWERQVPGEHAEGGAGQRQGERDKQPACRAGLAPGSQSEASRGPRDGDQLLDVVEEQGRRPTHDGDAEATQPCRRSQPVVPASRRRRTARARDPSTDG